VKFRTVFMRQFFSQTHKKGFTLIELVIVMAIMGILIAASASTFQTSRIKGKDGRRKSDLKQLQTALETYINDWGLYPAASGGIITACGGQGTSTCDWGSAFTDQNGTVYMATLPSDSSAPSIQYLYVVSSDKKKYQLFTYLENTLDPDIKTYAGKTCGSAGHQCNYGVSSANTTPSVALP
jgi:prepilin-type N-terminal cleavage/methylation domain-containing protein